MYYIKVNNICYGYDSNDFDGYFQNILIDNPEYILKNNAEDIKTCFADNVTSYFDDIPVNEDTDYSEVVNGFNEYIDWLLTLL